MRSRNASLITFAALFAVMTVVAANGFAQQDAPAESDAPPAQAADSGTPPAQDATPPLPDSVPDDAAGDTPAPPGDASPESGYEAPPAAANAPSTLDQLSAHAGARAIRMMNSAGCRYGCGDEGCCGECIGDGCGACGGAGCDACRGEGCLTGGCVAGGGCLTGGGCVDNDAEGCVRLGGYGSSHGCRSGAYGFGKWTDSNCQFGECPGYGTCPSCFGNGCYGGCFRGFPGSICCCNSRKAFPDDGWALPVRHPIHRTRVQYQRYWPTHWYGNPAAQYPSHYPMVYQPTDTTQLGFSYHTVPTWMPNRRMEPPAPYPACYHHRFCAGGNCYSGQCYSCPTYYQPCYTCPTSGSGTQQPVPATAVSRQARIAFVPTANGRAVPRFMTQMYPHSVTRGRAYRIVRPASFSR